jgi:hypothetical protein
MESFLAGETEGDERRADFVARMWIGAVAMRRARSGTQLRAKQVWTSIRLILAARGLRAGVATLGAVPETILKRGSMKSQLRRCVAAMAAGCAVRHRSAVALA